MANLVKGGLGEDNLPIREDERVGLSGVKEWTSVGSGATWQEANQTTPINLP